MYLKIISLLQTRQALLSLAFLSAFIVTGFQALNKEFKEPVADARIYVIGGAVLEKYGFFEIDEKLLNGERDPEDAGRNHFFMPGVSALYAAIMHLDSQFKDYSYCHMLNRQKEGGCGDPGGLVKFTQILALGLAAWIGFLIAFQVSGRQSIAWMTLFLLLASGQYGQQARQFLSDGYGLLALSAAILFLIRYIRKPDVISLCGLSLTLVLASYIRPSTLYVFYLLALAAAGSLLWGLIRSRASIVRLEHLILFAALYIGFMFPWAARNAALTGNYALTEGYAGYILAQRLAFNMMTFQEWCAAWIYWLPDFGDSLAATVFDPASYERLSVINPDGFYSIGNRAFAEEMKQAAGGVENLEPYLMDRLRSELFNPYLGHIPSTDPWIMGRQDFWPGKFHPFVACIMDFEVTKSADIIHLRRPDTGFSARVARLRQRECSTL